MEGSPHKPRRMGRPQVQLTDVEQLIQEQRPFEAQGELKPTPGASIDLPLGAVLRIRTPIVRDIQLSRPGMAPETKHLEVTLDTHVESVNLAEEMCVRVAEAAGFNEDECYRIGMSVREGVINAFHYGNQEKPEKKIHLAIELTGERMIIHVLDEGKGFRLNDVPDPLAQENLLSTSGRGIFLMKAFMDEFDVQP